MELLYYTFFIGTSFAFAKFSERNPSVYKLILLAIYMSFFLAIRQVPGDNIQYEEAYKGLIDREYEYGWATLISLCKSLGFSLVAYKCIAIYFIHIGCFFLALKKEWLKYLSLFVLFYCLMGLESSSNIMRHWMAACVVLIGYRFYMSPNKVWKKWMMYLVCVFVATRFHNSAYIAIIAPVLIEMKMPSYKLQCIVFILAFAISPLFINAWKYAAIFLSSDDFYYNFYFNHYDVNKVETTSGFGQLYFVLESCMIAWLSRRIIDQHQKWEDLKQYYHLYFWGMTVFFLTCSFQDMSRLALYFSIVQIIVVPLFVVQGLKMKGIGMFFSSFIVLMRILLFVKTVLADEIYGITPIKFLL